MGGTCWVLIDRSGAELRRTEPFPSRAEAEAWMSEHWADLVDEGAGRVLLTEGEETVYDMSLDPE
jgi:hypothetical protein